MNETPPSGVDGQGSEGSTDSTPLVTHRRRERHRAVPLLPEVRHFKATGLEIRSNAKTDEIVITGVPIVYDTPYVVVDMFGEFEERMMPGVASDVLSRPTGADVRFLFNHDGLPLARTKHQEDGVWVGGTMAIQDSLTEMRFQATLDARQQLANDVAIAVERGDITQMSIGFVCALDEWDENWERRSVYRFAELPDISAVTYPCSATTSIEIAQRMALAMPVESRARIRKVYAELREGKPPREEYEAAFRAMISAPTLDPGEETRTPAGTGPLGEPQGTGKTWASTGDASNGNDTSADGTQSQGGGQGSTAGIADGTGSRSAPATAAERRAASKSFDDQQSAVYDALCDRLAGPGGYPDIWIVACAADWVVWKAYGPGCGMYQLPYSVDGTGAVALGMGAPQPVQATTTYVATRAADAPAVADEKTSSASVRFLMEAHKRKRR